MENHQEHYHCVGICMADTDSGYCIGCGRPPFSPPEPITAATETDLNKPLSNSEPATAE